MTRRGLSLIVAAVGCWAVGRLLGIEEFFVLSVAAAAAIGLGLAAVLFAGSAVAVRRRLDAPRLPAGSSTRVHIELRNESRLPLPLLLAEDTCDPILLQPESPSRFVVPGLRRSGTVTAVYTAHGNLRGRYTLGPLQLRVRDPFGTVERTRRYRATDELIVYPAVEALPGGLHLGRHHGAGASRSRRLFNAGDEFHTMREFTEGDDLRQVHWPSTAHRQRLMIRQNELSWDTQATVLCDTRSARHHGEGRESSLERAVSAAASVVCHLDVGGYRTRLVTEHDTRPPQASTRDAALDRLAVIEPSRGRALAPVLDRLRSAEGQGLFVAILPAPPDSGRDGGRSGADSGVSAELSTLLQVGRGFAGRMAVILDTDAPGSAEQAARTAALLTAASWRAVVWSPGHRLADTWRDLLAARGAATAVGSDDAPADRDHPAAGVPA